MRTEAMGLMQRYMKSIYDMTTINHDHLSASLVRVLPKNRFNAYDLRRRVYHAAEAVREKTDIFLHRDLQTDQLHLLTDDHHHRMEDFLAVASEKGIIRQEGDHLVKDPSRFSSPYDFHRARIDNPVEVMANAVEPLKDLQRIVRKSAWLPSFWLKRSIAARLVRRAQDEFLQDYNTHFIEGESKPKQVGMPYMIRGRSRDVGVVLIHGYMAAPLEVKELAAYLGRKGLWVYAPRVKGHGTSPEDLAETSYQQWTDSVDIGYAIMRNTCRRVVVGGFSNGAGLALDLAARTQGTVGVFAICPPMRLQDISTRLVPAVDVWNKLMKRVRLEEARVTFVENHPEFPEINYLRNPVSGVRELERLMDAIQPRLAGITAPALVIQAQSDPVVHPKGCVQVYEALGSESKSYLVCNFNRHGIIRGSGAETVHQAVWDFIARLR